MKTRLFLTISVVLVLIVTLAWNTSAVSANITCDPAFVTQEGGVFTVEPTGVDDTTNLQCAFNAAVTYGAGAKVQLQAGNFHTGQIVVNNFRGTFTGDGKEKTVVTNLPNLYVVPSDFYQNPPAVDNPWPALFAFVNGDFLISDLAIYISGENATTGWSIFGIDPPITELALAIGILGSEAYARVDHVSIEGEVMQNSLTGYSVINGIYFEGFIGEIPWHPLSGSFQLYHSTFKRVGFATPVMNISDATIKVSHNHYEDTFIAMDAADTLNSTLEFSHNKVINAWIGFDLWNNFVSEHVGSTFLIKSNVLQGELGIAFEQTFGEGNQCLILGNNVQNVNDIGIYLGSGTEGCTVVGGSNKSNVFDLGTDNILTGVNNMGTGVGPTIQAFLKMRH